MVQTLHITWTEGAPPLKKLDVLAAALLVIGGLNWGLVAVAQFDLVAWLVGLDFGQTNAVSRVIYRPGRRRRHLPDRPAARDPPTLGQRAPASACLAETTPQPPTRKDST